MYMFFSIFQDSSKNSLSTVSGVGSIAALMARCLQYSLLSLSKVVCPWRAKTMRRQTTHRENPALHESNYTHV